MLSLRSIHYTIGRKKVLQDINLDFLPGEFNMILGPNGSGKTSLLNIFSGEQQDYRGSVCYSGQDLKGMSKPVLAVNRAVMSQQPELSFPLTVEEVVMMGRYPHFIYQPNKKDEHICTEVMGRLNIQSFAKRDYLTLSGGEKQRVQFARVLAQVWEPPVSGYRYLFLDEPLGSLDINYQQEFLQMAREFVQHQTVLVAIMHDINLAIQYADRLFFLKDGKLIAQGLTDEIVNAVLIKNVFDVDTVIVNNPVSNKPLVLYAGSTK